MIKSVHCDSINQSCSSGVYNTICVSLIVLVMCQPLESLAIYEPLVIYFITSRDLLHNNSQFNSHRHP